MELKPLFYAWVPAYARLTTLTLLAFVTLCANGVFQGITTDMYSDLGEYAEPYTLAGNALFIGMGSSIILMVRLLSRFTIKTLVLTGLFMQLLMNLVCATTNSATVTVAAAFLLGFTKIFALGPVYLAWLGVWSKKMESAKLYPFFYFMALGGLYFITWFTAYLTNLYSWRYAYYAIFILIALSLILAVLFIENHPLKRKIPLYQLDFPGLLLLITTMMLINYVVVYGKVEDWFNSTTITAAFFGAFVTGLLFIRRELTVKRPYLNVHLFKKSSFSLGLGLLVLLGVFTPATFQSAYSGSVLHFESIRNAELNLYLIPGIIAGCIMGFFWYRRKPDGQLLIIIGFAAMVGYHMLMYGRFVNDLNMADFWFPSLIKGFGLALLFISIGLYTTAGFPFPQVLKVVGVIVLVRSFLGPGVFSGLYSYFLYAEKTRHLSKLANHIDANEPQVFAQGNIARFYQNIQQQASLTALKEISGTIIIFGLSVIVILFIIHLYRKINLTVSNGPGRNL
jgi:DHA2 family multidrug resistance protein